MRSKSTLFSSGDNSISEAQNSIIHCDVFLWLMTWFWANHHPLCLTPRFLLILWPGVIAERWIKGAKEGEVKQTKLQIMTDPQGGGRRSQTKTNAVNIMRGGKLTPARIKGLKVETQKESKTEFSKGARWRERGRKKWWNAKFVEPVSLFAPFADPVVQCGFLCKWQTIPTFRQKFSFLPYASFPK